MLIRGLPHSEEAEKSVLGSIMLDSDAINKVLPHIDHVSFLPGKHRLIFRAAEDLNRKAEPIDQVTIIDQLKCNKSLEQAGGAYYITGLVETTPSSANVEYYAKMVQEASIRRKLIVNFNNFQNDAYLPETDIWELMGRAQKDIFELYQNKVGGGFVRIGSQLDDFIKKTSQLYDSGKRPGLETGFYEWDDYLGGLEPGLTHYLAARPSMGKTALALAIADNVASAGHKVGIILLESICNRMIRRLIVRRSKINSSIFNTGRITETEFKKIVSTATTIRDLPIFIDDSSEADINGIIAKCRMLIQRENVELMIFDHLQLTHDKTLKKENRNREIGEISRYLHSFAKEVHIPILVLSQLSRASEGRMPTLSDLRDSGELEQNADTVTFIFRPEQAGIGITKSGEKTEGIAEILVAKQRDGRTGKFKLLFLKESAAFENMAQRSKDLF